MNYIYVCVHMCAQVYSRVCVCICSCVYMLVRVCVCMYACLRARVFVGECACESVCVNVCLFPRMFVWNTRTYIYNTIIVKCFISIQLSRNKRDLLFTIIQCFIKFQ